jgi:ATP-dependent RNA helicase DeaD
MRAIQELGYEKPSPIQAEALPHLLEGPTDFLGLAATGTGKTAAFAIPLLQKVDPSVDGVQALVLCPTRELAIQVAGQIDLLGKYLGIRALPVYGGAGYGDQIKGLKRGTAVVVGTPGRVIDHIEKGTLVLDEVSTLILDEADEMISMGFKEDIEAVLEKIPCEKSNIWLFSATMSGDVRHVADEYLTDPAFVQINRKEMLPDTIEQLYFRTHESDKPEVLCKLMDAAVDFYGLIFCQTKSLVVDLTQYLRSRGYLVDCLHGDMEQDARERTMKGFRDRKVRVLVCTDVASRGLDVKDITHVVNYSIPRELDNYVHRIGRTARSGKTGVAMSLVTPSHRGLIARIERMTKSRMTEGRIPSRREIGARKVESALPKFVEQTWYTRALEVMSDEWKQALSAMSSEEVAARFLATMYPEVFADRAPESAAKSAPENKRSVRPSPVAPVSSVVVRPVAAPAAVAVKVAAKVAPVVAPVAAVSPVEAVEPVAVVETEVDAEAALEEAPVGVAAAESQQQQPAMLTLESVLGKEAGESDEALAAAKTAKAAKYKAKKAAKSKAKKAAAEASPAADSVTLAVEAAFATDAAEATVAVIAEADDEERPVAFGDEPETVKPLVTPLAEPVRRSKSSKLFIKRDRSESGDRAQSGDSSPEPFARRYGESRGNGGYGKPRDGGEGGYGSKPRYGASRPQFGAQRGEGGGGYGYGKPRGEGGFGGPAREGGGGYAGKPRYGASKFQQQGGGEGAGASRTWSKPKRTKGWVGGKPAAFEGGADVGLGRAPVDRAASSWSKPRAPWNGPKKPYGAAAGGSKPYGKKREGGFERPRWNKDKA